MEFDTSDKAIQKAFPLMQLVAMGEKEESDIIEETGIWDVDLSTIYRDCFKDAENHIQNLKWEITTLEGQLELSNKRLKHVTESSKRASVFK